MIKSKDGNTDFKLGNGELKMCETKFETLRINPKILKELNERRQVNWNTNEFEVEEINLKDGFIKLSKIK